MDVRRYFSCGECGLVFRENAQIMEDQILNHYKKNYFSISAYDKLEGRRLYVFESILEKIENEVGIGKILDVGCGCGNFLKTAAERGWKVKGIDPSKDSVSHAKDILGDAVSESTLKTYSGEEVYDAITMINVLEHTVDPWENLILARHRLKVGGLLYLRFPNGDLHMNLYSFFKDTMFEQWIRNWAVVHQYSFTKKYIKRLISDMGFSQVKVQNSRFSDNFTFSRKLPQSINAMSRKALWFLVSLIEAVSFKRMLFGPTLDLTARKL